MGGGGSKSKARSAPGAPGDVMGLRHYLIDMLGNAGEESPFYGKMSSMMDNLMSKGLEPEPYQTAAIKEMTETGAPFKAENYKDYEDILMPIFKQNIERGTAQARETSGMGGGLRGSPGEYYQGKAIGETTTDFNNDIMDMAKQSYESAQGRRMGGIEAGFQQAKEPYDLLSSLITSGVLLEESKYPLLAEAIQMATAGMGQYSKEDSRSQQTSGGCGFTFTAGNRLTNNVKTLRDELFPKGSPVEIGYRKMCKWLVPRIDRNWFVKKVVRAIMLNPICSIADNYYGYNSYGWVFRPIGYFWKNIWEKLGR
jgi:hypothetical protein